MSEPLIKCLLCGRNGFTRRGLRSHWCPAKAGKKVKFASGVSNSKKSAPLTKEEWQHAVDSQSRKGRR